MQIALLEAGLSSRQNLAMAPLSRRNQDEYRFRYSHRALQGSAILLGTECEVAYAVLFEDQDLLDASNVYLEDYEQIVNTIDIDKNCQVDDVSIACDISDEPTSARDFQTACTTAGGKPQGFEMDVACSVTSDQEDTAAVVVDFPLIWDCLPIVQGQDCKAEIEILVADIRTETANAIESNLRPIGRAMCDVGEEPIIESGTSVASCSWTTVMSISAAVALASSFAM